MQNDNTKYLFDRTIRKPLLRASNHVTTHISQVPHLISKKNKKKFYN